MTTFLSFFRERDFRPDTSTWTLNLSFSAFSRIWLIHSFWLSSVYLYSFLPFGLESSSSHSHTLKSINVYLLGEWMNQQVFFSPWVPSSSAPSDFPFIAILERVVCTCCVGLPNSHLFLNFWNLTYYYAVEFPLVVISSLPNIYSLSKLLDSACYPATFDTADHSGSCGRESLFIWLFFNHSILILLSPSLSVSSLTFHIAPFLYFNIFLPYTYRPSLCLYILLLCHLSLFKNPDLYFQ